MMNTKDSAQISFLIFKKDGDLDYTGVCYELAIVMQGSDPERLKKDLEEAAEGYFESICKNNLSDKLLNQTPPKEIADIFKKYVDERVKALNQKARRQSAPKRRTFESVQMFTQDVGSVCLAT